MNGNRVRIVEAQPIAFEGLDTLLRGQQGLQIEPDHLVRQNARIGVAAKHWYRFAPGMALAREVRAVEHAPKDGCERPVSRVLNDRQDLRWWPSIMNVAVGQDEGSQTRRVMGSEDLRDGAAAVVADQVDLLNPQRVKDLANHARLRGE